MLVITSRDVPALNKIARFVAIEPHLVNFKLVQNSTGSEKAGLSNIAVVDKEGQLELFGYVNNDGSPHASLYKEVITDLHKSDATAHRLDVKPLFRILNCKPMRGLINLRLTQMEVN
jgi:hypothetical protein